MVFRFYKNLLTKNTFLKNVSILFLGSVVAQLSVIVLSPVLSRLYTPEHFGGLGIVISIVSTITVIANLRLELVIALPKYLKTSNTVFYTAFIINSLITLLFGYLLYFFKDHLSLFFNFNFKLKYVLAIALLIFLNANFNAFTYSNVWSKEFKTNSFSSVIRSTFTNLFQIAFGILSPTAFGLLLGQIFGRVLAIIYLISKAVKTKLFTNVSLSKRKFFFVLKKYKTFPTYSAPQALISSLSLNSPVLILGCFFSPVTVGFYWFSERLLKTPINFISSSVRQVFLQKASNDINNKSPVFSYYIKITFFLFLLGVVPVVVLIIWGVPLFETVFGKNWGVAGLYSGWIVVGWIGVLINVPSVVLIQTYEFQKFYLFYEVFLSVFKISALILGGLKCNPLLSVILYSVVSLGFNLFLVSYIGTKVFMVEKSA